MLKKILVSTILVLLLITLSVNSNPKKIRIIKPVKSFVRVMVIDSGYNEHDSFVSKHLCKENGLIDLTETDMSDPIKHGGLVLSLLSRHALDSNYCLNVVKYYDDLSTPLLNGHRFLQAMQLIETIKPDIVNISSGGTTYEGQELQVILKNKDVTFIVAAGNNGESLDEEGVHYYPASYVYFDGVKNIRVVGSLDEYGKKLPSSNWGSMVKYWERGEYAEGTGTSFAAPVYTGKLIYDLTHKKVIEE